jgi:hypothetical protein
MKRSISLLSSDQYYNISVRKTNVNCNFVHSDYYLSKCEEDIESHISDLKEWIKKELKLMQCEIDSKTDSYKNIDKEFKVSCFFLLFISFLYFKFILE